MHRRERRGRGKQRRITCSYFLSSLLLCVSAFKLEILNAETQRSGVRLERFPLKNRLLLLTAVFLAGCGKAPQAVSTSAAAPAIPPGAGTIHGIINYSGPTPPQRNVAAGFKVEGQDVNVADESIVVNSNHTLKNVIVYLKDAPAGDGGGPAATLDQQGFHYVPHVLALQVQQPLVIHNSDHHIHNIHFKCTINPEVNFAMMDVGALAPITFKAPEFFQIKCDVHPWMDCEAAVFDHPWFAVSGDDGSFRINNVPPGTWTLVARHELFREISQPVTLADKQTVESDFTYQPPKEGQ
jgi:hypothetical protein